MPTLMQLFRAAAQHRKIRDAEVRRLAELGRLTLAERRIIAERHAIADRIDRLAGIDHHGNAVG